MFNQNSEDLVVIFSEMLERSLNPVCVLNQDYQYIYCNGEMANLIGLAVDQILSRTPAQVLQQAHQENKGIAVDQGDFKTWMSIKECRLRNLDESEFFTHTVDDKHYKMNRIRLSSGEHVIVGTDISDLKQTQVELEQALSELDMLAHTCDLTDVPNRRHFMLKAEEEFRRAKRYRSMFSIVLADIDYFKQINDTHGHDIGDKALKYFAGLIAKAIRTTDMLGRIGGEEFAILMPNTDLADARIFANRLRQQIEKSPFLLDSGQHLPMTASFGVSEYRKTDQDESLMLSRADKRLYKAKASGRNQVC